MLGLSVRAAAAVRESKSVVEDAPAAAAEWLRKNYGDNPYSEIVARSFGQAKSLNATDQQAAGMFIKDETADGVIELLRPQIALMALGPREVPLPGGTLILPTHTTGSTGTWLGEEEEIPTTQPSFGERTMRGRTYAALVLISNKLLRSASIQMDAFVATDLRMDAGTALDLAYIRGNSAARPRGVRHIGRATATSNATATLDTIDVDIVACLSRMGAAGLTMTRLGSMFSWREWQKLFNLRFTSGDRYVYRDELITGNLLGFPYRRTSNIPTNLSGAAESGGNESEFYMMDMDHVVVGRGEGFAIDISTEASVSVGNTQVNAYQRNQSVIRMMVETDINIRHQDAVQVVTGVTWGA
jgi:HK97 family phage major capsid protein